MLFPCPIQVNNSLLPTRVFTRFRIKIVVFRMILICDVVFVLVYMEVKSDIESTLEDILNKEGLMAVIDESKH